MTAKEHRKWIKYWIRRAEYFLESTQKATPCGKLKELGHMMYSLTRAEMVITELEKLEGRKPRWTARAQ